MVKAYVQFRITRAGPASSAREDPAAVEAADFVSSEELLERGGERLVPDLERAAELLLCERPGTAADEGEDLVLKTWRFGFGRC